MERPSSPMVAPGADPAHGSGDRSAALVGVLARPNAGALFVLVATGALPIASRPATAAERQGIIQASWNWPYNRKDTHVYGERGDSLALDRTRLRVRLGDGDPKEIEVPAPPAPLDDPFAYLAAVVRGEITPGPADLSSLPLNLVVVEILDAAALSAREGRRIKLPQVP